MKDERPHNIKIKVRPYFNSDQGLYQEVQLRVLGN